MDIRRQMVVRAAELYYEEALNQNQIAKIMDISRPTVSRLLEEGKANGVVEIVVHSPVRKNPQLSSQIRGKLNLRDVMVVAGIFDHEMAIKKCSFVASQFLLSIMESHYTLGISWGPQLAYLTDILEEQELNNINVVQMVGCMGTGNSIYNGLELAMKISKKLHGTSSNIYAPVYVKKKEVHQYLLQESQIANTLKEASEVDVAIMGIGSLMNEKSTLSVTGYLTEEERQELLSLGAVGHLLARFFDRDGVEVQLANKYVVSAPLDSLKHPKWSIGIAASAYKAESVLAAIRAGYINTLIIDEALAEKLMVLI
ncbi:sugar-binding transcriptional regulator [Gottschalkiaceae bacterium SANA]|nr:sugar-binding transcriptional regulator [Gottschalkiaceae bacterium SANA]